jgi:Cu/Zn superoxide dismutase
MHTRTKLLVAFAATIAAVAACESSTETDSTLHFAAVLNGSKEVPATTSTAIGQALVVVNSSGTLSYSVTWSGLTGVYNGAHIHGPADSTGTAAVLVDFSVKPAGSAGDTITTPPAATGFASGNLNIAGSTTYGGITGDSLVKLLNAGKLYVNIHTVANAAGEIRGQLKKQ